MDCRDWTGDRTHVRLRMDEHLPITPWMTLPPAPRRSATSGPRRLPDVQFGQAGDKRQQAGHDESDPKDSQGQDISGCSGRRPRSVLYM